MLCAGYVHELSLLKCNTSKRNAVKSKEGIDKQESQEVWQLCNRVPAAKDKEIVWYDNDLQILDGKDGEIH